MSGKIIVIGKRTSIHSAEKTEEITLFLVIWWDSQLLICPFRSIRPGEVTLQKREEP